MATKIGINGFGRIGRCVLRAIVERGLDDIEVALINDITDDTTLAHLLKYDSTFGVFKHDVSVKSGAIEVAGRTIKTSEVRDPKEIAWKAEGVDVVLECTGLFVSADKAKWHLDAGAKKVLLSAPGKGEGIRTIVLGVNDKDYDPKTDHIVSVGSCTTNCLAPVARVLLDNFGIKYGLMTTTHAYTNDQNLLDLPHRKCARGRRQHGSHHHGRGSCGGAGHSRTQRQIRWTGDSCADHRRIVGGPGFPE